MMCDIVEKARIFATAAHAAVKQTRKYTGEPYITHPEAVAKLVATVPHAPEMLAAAWLHDTVEDTGVDINTIDAVFGVEVARLVWELTDVSKPENGNREFRKAIDRAHSANGTAEAQTIKLADLIDNTATIEARDPAFAKVYHKEKALLLDVLTRGDAALMKMARAQLEYPL